MKVVSWHPVLTDHQSYTLAALQQTADCDLKVFVAKMAHAERQAQGWISPHAASLCPTLLPKKGWLKFSYQQLRAHRDAVHLFGSPFEQVKLIVVLLLAVALGLRVYLISEPYSSKPIGYLSDKQQFVNWVKAKLRPLIYSIYGLLLRSRIGGVFAISCRAFAQYQSIGISSKKIFPFGYFVPYQAPSYSLNSPRANLNKNDFRVVFIGNLIATKGLDILIDAIHAQNKSGLSLNLDVYGPGDSNQYDFNQSLIRYCGVIPFGTAQAVISEYDVLVLPSRYDGWGVVVNEALMAGVPVICSDQVGAGAVVEKWQCGAIFASEDKSDLAIKLTALLHDQMLLKKMSLAASKAGATLDPKVAGQYMFDIISQDTGLDGMQNKPECPWYDCQKFVKTPAHG